MLAEEENASYGLLSKPPKTDGLMQYVLYILEIINLPKPISSNESR